LFADGNDLSRDDLEKKVIEKLANLLMMAADDVDVAQPMIHYGVDSLISLDITNWMRKEFNLQINQMDILEGMTTASLIEQAFA
jgi:acyl carrier protein